MTCGAGASAGGAGAGTGVTSAPISAASGAGVDEGGPHTSPSVRRLGCGFVAALPSLSCAVLNINATLAIPSLDFLAANSSGPGTAPAVWTVKHVLTAFAVPPTLLDAPAPGAKVRALHTRIRTTTGVCLVYVVWFSRGTAMHVAACSFARACHTRVFRVEAVVGADRWSPLETRPCGVC